MGHKATHTHTSTAEVGYMSDSADTDEEFWLPEAGLAESESLFAVPDPLPTLKVELDSTAEAEALATFDLEATNSGAMGPGVHTLRRKKHRSPRSPRSRSRSVDAGPPEHMSVLSSQIEDEIYSRLRMQNSTSPPPPCNNRSIKRRSADVPLSQTHGTKLQKSCSEVLTRGRSHPPLSSSTLATLRASRRVLFEPSSVASDILISRSTCGGKWELCYLAVVGSSTGPRLLLFASSKEDATAEQDFPFRNFVNCKRFSSELSEIHLIGSAGVASVQFQVSNELMASEYAAHLKHQLLLRLPKLSTPDVGKVHNAISRKLRRQQMHGGESLLTWATRTVKQLVSNQQVDLAELLEQSGSHGLAQSPCRHLAVELSEYCAEFAQKMYRECGCEQEVGEASELDCWLAQMQLHELRCAIETVVLEHCGGMAQLRRWVSFMPRANQMQYEYNLRLPIAASINYPDNCTTPAPDSLDQRPPQGNNNNNNQLSELRRILAEPVAAIHQIADAESVAEVVSLWTVAKQQAFKVLSGAWGEQLDVPDTPRVLEALFCAAQSHTLLIDALLAKLFTPDDDGGFVPDQYVLRAEESGLNGAKAVNWLLRPQWLLTKDISDEAMESFYSCHARPMETSLLQYRFGGNRLVKAKLKQHLVQAMTTCSCQCCTKWPHRQELTPTERQRVREFCDSWHAELQLLDKIRSEQSLQSSRLNLLAASPPSKVGATNLRRALSGPSCR